MPADNADAPETDAEDTDQTTDDQTDDSGTDEKDWKAEAEKWQALSKKNEGRAKANATAAKELEKLKASQMSDTDKAVAEAEARGRKAAGAEGSQRLAAAEIKAALTGVVPDPAAIVEDLNLARYVTDDGEVDGDAVVKLKAKFEGLAPKKPVKAGSTGSAEGGTRGSGDPEQLTRADLKGMSPKQINEAKKAGRLRDVLAGKA